MANARKLEFFTHVFRAEGCHDLPAFVEPTPAGDEITTAWELDPREKAAVLGTGLVLVKQIGIVPPMTVTAPQVETPVEERFSVWASDGDGDPLIVPAQDVLLLVLHHLTQGATRLVINRVD